MQGENSMVKLKSDGFFLILFESHDTFNVDYISKKIDDDI